MDRGRTIAEGSPRELIATHIEPYVTEIYGEGMAEWRSGNAGRLCDRIEVAGETLFCYSHAAEAIADSLKDHLSLRYLHRPSNLEDVFLKLTGRELRDQ
jgi:lipooligosaccharide transport system ATP-binding protein